MKEEWIVSRFKVLDGLKLQHFESKSRLSVLVPFIFLTSRNPRSTMLSSINVNPDVSNTSF
jgi:hypothetical protein